MLYRVTDDATYRVADGATYYATVAVTSSETFPDAHTYTGEDTEEGYVMEERRFKKRSLSSDVKDVNISEGTKSLDMHTKKLLDKIERNSQNLLISSNDIYQKVNELCDYDVNNLIDRVDMRADLDCVEDRLNYMKIQSGSVYSLLDQIGIVNEVKGGAVSDMSSVTIQYDADRDMVEYTIPGGLPHKVQSMKDGTYKYGYNRDVWSNRFWKAVDEIDFTTKYQRALLYIVNYYPREHMIDHDNVDVKLFIDVMVKAPFLPDDSPDVLSLWMDCKISSEKKTVAYLGEYESMVRYISENILR